MLICVLQTFISAIRDRLLLEAVTVTALRDALQGKELEPLETGVVSVNAKIMSITYILNKHDVLF